MNWLCISPIITCFLLTIAMCISWQYALLQKVLHLMGAIALLIVTGYLFFTVLQKGILVTQLGHYPAPFGITFVIDTLSAIMLFVTGIIGFCVSLYAIIDINIWRQELGFYIAYWILLMGICGAFSTGDLFNLYVWFEVMLIASFILLVLGNKKKQLDGAMKYVSINLVATILMLLAIALLYGMTGTLNMADLAQKLKVYPLGGTATAVVLLLTIAFSIKAALFPLFFWLPASYHTTNVSSAAIFAGMLTKVGVYALIRLTTLILPDSHYILTILLISAGLTMITGVLGAATQYHFRRLLSFHIISQIGYIIMGLAIHTPLAIASALFFMIHNIFAKTNLFFISGVCSRIGNSADIRKLSGFYRYYPGLALLFFISAYSLAGIPPSSGFWGKLMLLKAALITKHYIIAGVSLFVSLMTLYSMTKIWNHVFWKETPLSEVPLKETISKAQWAIFLLPIVILALATLSLGLLPQIYFNLMDQASNQLLNPNLYIHAVLGVNSND